MSNNVNANATNNLNNLVHPVNSNEGTNLKDAALFFVSIGSGSRHSLAVTSQGHLYSWGAGSYGQLGPHKNQPPLQSTCLNPRRIEGVENVRFVACDGGIWHSIALSDQGEVFTWGAGGYGQLGHLTLDQLEEIAAVPKRVSFPGLSPIHVRRITAGDTYTSILTEEGDIWSWGQNAAGQLGLDCEATTTATTTDGADKKEKEKASQKLYLCVMSPTKVTVSSPGTCFREIAAGGAHTLALSDNIEDYLGDDLDAILSRNLYPNLSFQYNNRQYHVHSYIVLARVPQFLEILRRHTELTVLDHILTYLYTNRIPKSLELSEMKELLSVCSWFGLDEIRDLFPKPVTVNRAMPADFLEKISYHKQSIAVHLKTILDQRRDTDFELVLKSKSIKCHKAILGYAPSLVFVCYFDDELFVCLVLVPDAISLLLRFISTTRCARCE
jgi:hypothetical protein